MLSKQLLNAIKVAIFVVSGLLLIVFPSITQAWQGPTAEPPNGNVAQPLNRADVFNSPDNVISGIWNQLKITPGSCSSASSLVGWNGSQMICTSTSAGGGVNGTVNYVSKFTSSNTLGNSTIFDNGKVGVSDATPLDTLSVGGSIYAQAGVRVSNEGETALSNNAPWYGIGRTNVNNRETGHNGFFTQLAGYYGLLFSVADATSAIKTNGQWGINTLTPNAQATVDINKQNGGTARLRITDLTYNPELQLQYGNASDNAHWSVYANQTNDSFNIWGTSNDQSSGGANYLTILKTGNVGIGGSPTGARLSVLNPDTNNSVPEDLRISHMAAGGIGQGTAFGMYIGNFGTELARVETVNDAASQSSLRFYTFNRGIGEKMRITGAGDVGVGKTNPATKLDVVGTTTATGLKINGTAVISNLVGTGDRCLQTNATGQISATAAACGTGTGTTGGVNYGYTGQVAYYPAAGTNVTGTPVLNIISNKVGIGINAPRSKQEISFASDSTLPGGVNWVGQTLYRTGATSNAWMAGLALLTSYQNSGAIIGGGGDGFNIYTYDGATATNRVTVASATGFVGIATNNPKKPLQIGDGPTYFPASAVSIITNTGANHDTAGSGIEFGIEPSSASLGEAGGWGYQSRKLDDYRGMELYVGRSNLSNEPGWGDALPAIKVKSTDGRIGIGTWEPPSTLSLSNELLYVQRNTQVTNKEVWLNLNSLKANNVAPVDVNNGISWSIGWASTSQKLWWLYRPANTTNLVLATGDNTPSQSRVTFQSDGKIGVNTTAVNAQMKVDAGLQYEPAVYGRNSFNGGNSVSSIIGVKGEALNPSSIKGIPTIGVFGTSDYIQGVGVYGKAKMYGVYGNTDVANGIAIYGKSDNINAYSGFFDGGKGLYSTNNSNLINKPAIYGGNFFNGGSITSKTIGILGEAGGTSAGFTAGVMGRATSTNAIGVYGESNSYRGVWGASMTSAGWAGYFTGGKGVGVEGSIKIGNSYGTITSGGNCSTAGAGTITYYNSHFYGCAGTTWKQLDN